MEPRSFRLFAVRSSKPMDSEDSLGPSWSSALSNCTHTSSCLYLLFFLLLINRSRLRLQALHHFRQSFRSFFDLYLAHLDYFLIIFLSTATPTRYTQKRIEIFAQATCVVAWKSRRRVFPPVSVFSGKKSDFKNTLKNYCPRLSRRELFFSSLFSLFSKNTNFFYKKATFLFTASVRCRARRIRGENFYNFFFCLFFSSPHTLFPISDSTFFFPDIIFH